MKGVRDLMETHRYTAKHLGEELDKSGIPGKWLISQNIYNWTGGEHRPKDPYVYVILARLFKVELIEIILRFTDVEETNEVEMYNIDEKTSNTTSKHSNW